MNMKRWIAVVAAAALLFVSVGVNSLSFIFTRDLNGFFNEMASLDAGYAETVIEPGTSGDRIAVLSLEGVIQDTGDGGLFSAVGYNHKQFLDQLAHIAEDQTIKGVVLYIDSPGGGVLESADIYDGLRHIQEERDIPIYASMGGMAASGGYYVAAPAQKIFAHPETLTGSIGVIMESVDYSKLAEKLGIDFNTIKTGKYKDIMNGTREMTEEEHAMLLEIANDSYERFVEIVAEGRNMSKADVKKVADGRIVNTRQAIEANLVDESGKLIDAINGLKEDYDLQKATVFEYAPADSFGSLFGVKVGGLFKKSAEQEMVERILSSHQAPRLMYLYGEN